MSNYAKRIAALLQQIQEEEAQTDTILTAIYGVREDTGKWELHTTAKDRTGQLKQEVIELDSQESAEARISTLESQNPPSPRGKQPEPITLFNVGYMDYCG